MLLRQKKKTWINQMRKKKKKNQPCVYFKGSSAHCMGFHVLALDYEAQVTIGTVPFVAW